MMRQRLRSAGVIAAVVALVGLAAWSVVERRGEAARESAEEATARAPLRVSTADGESIVTLEATARHDGIKTVALRSAPHRGELRAYGMVVDIRPLSALAGRYAGAKAQLEIAQAKLAASRAAFARAKKLYDDRQNVSAAQRDEAEAAFRVDAAGAAAAQAELRTIATAAQQDWGPVLGGAVAGDGGLVQRLIARDAVLLQVTLRPGQAAAGPPADAVLRLDDGSQVKLAFVSAAARTDPRLQGPSLLFTAPAASGLLPGTSVVALLPVGPPAEGVIVPGSAVVWHDGQAWAYFRVGPDRYARRPVPTGRPMPERGGYFVQGIADGSDVVVAGAQMLLSEEFRGQTQAGGQGDTD